MLMNDYFLRKIPRVLVCEHKAPLRQVDYGRKNNKYLIVWLFNFGN